ncbi:galacturonosyltransferase 12 [Prunus dulcis]|uniref:Hexosyltransferase n=1 Tax=Prunus dulcis TaxID=3755 RepID=A0A4Y1RCE9_PRUDU|nr:galacturonosyltransferase 12 [Prunus dulcis]
MGKGVREFIKVKVGSRRLSFVFVMTAVDTIDGERKCSTIGCLGKRLRPKILGRRLDSTVPEVIYQILEEPIGKDELQGRSDIPQSLDEFMAEIKEGKSDAKAFAVKLRDMVTLLEQRTRNAKIQEYLYRHVASSSIPKQLHCLALRLANEHASNAAARLQLPSAELVPALVDNSYFHFVLASDNVLAASVVATSLVRNSLRPHKVVLHIITDRKTYYPMQAWFSLHPLSPSIIEVKALHHFDWFTKGKVPVLEAMEKDQKVRSQFRGGSSAIVANNTDKPNVIAAKLQALSPKYNSVMNHIRIHLPEMFPSLDKVVFLDDDIVVQTDLSPLWDIDMNGKVNGAVETCRGEDNFVMSKRLKKLEIRPEPVAARNITPGLIAFHGHVHVIDPFWHMLGLGYQENTSSADVKSAGVIHFNGRAKPWLEIAFPKLRPFWAKYVDFSDKFIKSCHIRAS